MFPVAAVTSVPFISSEGQILGLWLGLGLRSFRPALTSLRCMSRALFAHYFCCWIW